MFTRFQNTQHLVLTKFYERIDINFELCEFSFFYEPLPLPLQNSFLLKVLGMLHSKTFISDENVQKTQFATLQFLLRLVPETFM